MQSLKAILVDDESSSIENLQLKLVEFCPGIQVVATSQRPEDAISLIQLHKPDVVFLDIEMPRMDGFKMLENLKVVDFDIVFVTAYDHYAIEAIRMSAFDYLVKPVVIRELQLTVDRLSSKTQKRFVEKLSVLRQSLSPVRTQEHQICISNNEGMEFVQIRDIVRIESSSNYSRVILAGGKTMVVAKLLKEFEEMLSGYRFFRIHNSHLINLLYISKYHRGDGGQILLKNGDLVDVSRRKKEEFLKLINYGDV